LVIFGDQRPDPGDQRDAEHRERRSTAEHDQHERHKAGCDVDHVEAGADLAGVDRFEPHRRDRDDRRDDQIDDDRVLR
jgi:hypothetical protein